jgi:hypothetical protein
LDSGGGVFEAVVEADDVARCDVAIPSAGAVRLHLEAADMAQGSGVSALNWVELQAVDAAVVERVVPSVVPAETASVVTLYGRHFTMYLVLESLNLDVDLLSYLQ